MNAKMRKHLRAACVLYLVFLTISLLFWVSLPSQTVTIEQWILGKSGHTVKHIHDRQFGTKYTTLGEIIDAKTIPPTLSFTSKSFCNEKFVGYNRLFAKLLNVVIDPLKGNGRRGGENISEVFNQPEQSEYYTLRKGYFTLQCDEDVKYDFHSKTHLSQWFQSLHASAESPIFQKRLGNWAVAVQRYEYANLYHTMTDYYNAFLVAKVFNMPLGNITILWIDGHPSGALDDTWRDLFGNVIRAGDIRQPIMFSRMVWSIMGYDSPMNKHQMDEIPLIEEFRTFFLSRYGIKTLDKTLNCDRLNITFIWRRDYLAHPRNPSGSVSRKIKNEDELISSAKKSVVNADIQGVQIDLLHMKKQLDVISQTDILVGMHGAGLAHTLFLPKHAGLVELYPTYWSNSNIHFQSMARWRHLHYLSWVNVDNGRELPGSYTRVDTNAIVSLIKQMTNMICG